MQGDALTIAWSSGRLTQVFCSRKYPKAKKDGEALRKFSGGEALNQKISTMLVLLNTYSMPYAHVIEPCVFGVPIMRTVMTL